LLARAHRRLVESLEPLSLTFEIILVEDCGGDNSWDVIKKLAGSDSRIRGFKLSRNFGQHNAITTGLYQIRGKWTIIMDCDLQDKPEDIPRLIKKTQEGYDIAIARSVVRHVSWLKRVTSDIFVKVLSWLAGYRYDNGVRVFRILSMNAADALRNMPEQTRTLITLGEWIGFRSTYIEVEVVKRYRGHSSYNLRGLFRLAFNTIIAFSDKPLRISIFIGVSMAGLAFFYGLFIFFRAILHEIPVPGWTSLIISLYLLGGLILAQLGVVGVYLGKTFEEAKKRPLYLISRQTLANGSDEPAPLSSCQKR
jgi:dolichol-phosphate mannosyltransferase